MRIDFDRICKLAGVPVSSRRSLNEAGNRSYHEDSGLSSEREYQFGNQLNEKDDKEDDSNEAHGRSFYHEMDGMEEGDGMHSEGDHLVEDEDEANERYDEGDGMHSEGGTMYAEEDEEETSKKEMMRMEEMVEVDIGELMSEIRRAKKIMQQDKRRKEQLQENHLKRIIQKEVQSVISEIEDHDSSWVYGRKKPTRSKRGHTAQGSFLRGIGFYD